MNNGFTEHPFFKMVMLGHMIQHHGNLALEKSGCLSSSHLKILMKVSMTKKCLQKDIANRMGHTGAAISRQIKKLEEEGLIKRSPGDDRRKMYISLTPKGANELQKCTDVMVPIMDEYFSILNTEEQEQFETLLHKILHNKLTHCEHGTQERL